MHSHTSSGVSPMALRMWLSLVSSVSVVKYLMRRNQRENLFWLTVWESTVCLGGKTVEESVVTGAWGTPHILEDQDSERLDQNQCPTITHKPALCLPARSQYHQNNICQTHNPVGNSYIQTLWSESEGTLQTQVLNAYSSAGSIVWEPLKPLEGGA